MFEKLRKPKGYGDKNFKKLFSYFVFGAICLVFVFFTPLGPNLLGGGHVAQVGSYVIRIGEYNQIYSSFAYQNKDKLEKINDKERKNLERSLQKQSLEYLIDMHIMIHGVQNWKFVLSDESIKDTILDIGSFQEKGRFLYTRYNSFLKSQKLTAKKFETRIYNQLLSANWNDLFPKVFKSNKLEILKNKDRFQVGMKILELNFGTLDTKKLRSLLVQKNLSQISKLAKKSDIKWKNIRNFSPTKFRLSEFNNDKKLLDRIFEYLPQTGLIPELITSRGKHYIVNVLSFKKRSSVGTLDSDIFLNFDKSNRLFSSWMKNIRDSVKVSYTKGFLPILGSDGI